MNTRILSPRFVQRATISAASESTGGPVSNLLHPQPGKPWIAPDPDQAVFTIDIGAGTLDTLELEGYDTISLLYAMRSEAGVAATATIDVANSIGGLASPTYSSGAQLFRMTPDIDPTWTFIHWWHVFSSLRSERYIRGTLDFPGAAAVHLSQAVWDKALIPQGTLAPGFGMNAAEDAVVTKSIGGTKWVQGRPLARSGPLEIRASGPEAPTRIQGELGRLYREVGKHSPVVLIVDDAPTEFAMDKVFYGNLSQTTPTPLAMAGFGEWGSGFEFEEWR